MILDGVTTVDVKHHGRPINDTGGAAFPAGRDRQWDQDLYFMMLLNLSGKPGEIPGQTAVAATTGRFGLGFKSVHLVSRRLRPSSAVSSHSRSREACCRSSSRSRMTRTCSRQMDTEQRVCDFPCGRMRTSRSS